MFQKAAPQGRGLFRLAGVLIMIVRPSNKADLPAVDALLARSYPKLL
jgi:hypothetical protein